MAQYVCGNSDSLNPATWWPSQPAPSFRPLPFLSPHSLNHTAPRNLPMLGADLMLQK